MSSEKVAAIFDVGKTNKKLLLFNEQYRLVHESCVQLTETVDEDGFPCEDIHALTDWMICKFEWLSVNDEFKVAAINFTAYGASFVHLDHAGEPCTALYNYLKPYPHELKSKFYESYGGEERFAVETASPVLGSLNSGMQLYRLKYEQPEVFQSISTSLHLPQYLSYILSGKKFSDLTSLGCHTNLWNYVSNGYHEWVNREGLNKKFAPLLKGGDLVNDTARSRQPPIGVGLHDSSAALIPYLKQFPDPFVLISTGTWCISMNPFNSSPLTPEELRQDCLCYLTYTGKQVKSSRLFAGYDHETQLERLAEYFHKPTASASVVQYSEETVNTLRGYNKGSESNGTKQPAASAFGGRELSAFPDFEVAYHQLIMDIMDQQVASTKLITDARVKNIFVDGGFGKNGIYMHLLARAFPEYNVYSATVSQSTGLGAALAIHEHWNKQHVTDNLIDLIKY
jgi:sugar (pentulose or hexulose) kinase